MPYYASQTLVRQTTKKTGALVNAASINLFTVAGGRILLAEFIGVITTVIGAPALTIKIVADVAGTDSDMCAASASLAAKIAGTLLHVIGPTATALSVSTGEGAIAGNTQNIIVNPCTIAEICTNPTTGAIDWYAVWEPLDVGATLVAV